MVIFQLGHLSLSPKPWPHVGSAPRFHVIAPVEEGCSHYTPSSSSTMHREGINGIIHLKTALPASRFSKIKPNLQGGMEGGVGFYKWKGGVEHSTLFCLALKRFFVKFCAMFFDATVQGKENILNTRFTNLKFCKKPAIA